MPFVCECGSEHFFTHIDEEITAYYDGDCNEIDGGEIHNAGQSHNWPYRCVDCEREYSQIPPLDTEGEWLKSKERYYLDHSACCPICNSSSIDGGNLEVDGTSVWQPVTCSECHAEWTDIYHLKSVEIDSYPTNKVPSEIGPSEVPNPNKAFKK